MVHEAIPAFRRLPRAPDLALATLPARHGARLGRAQTLRILGTSVIIASRKPRNSHFGRRRRVHEDNFGEGGFDEDEMDASWASE